MDQPLQYDVRKVLADLVVLFLTDGAIAKLYAPSKRGKWSKISSHIEPSKSVLSQFFKHVYRGQTNSYLALG